MDGKPKHDSRYVRMMALNDEKTEDGSWNFEDRPLRDCTDDDWARLYEPDLET